MKAKQILSSVTAAALAVSMTPTMAFASQTASAAEKDAPAQIEGTAGVDYEDGEVIVAVRGGQAALEAETGTSWLAQLLGASANKAGESDICVQESLASVSADDVQQSAQELGTEDDVDLDATADAASSEATDDTDDADDIEILELTCDNVAQAIADLSNLECVVTAQPNYRYTLVDDADADADDDAVSSQDAASSQDDTAATSTQTDATASSQADAAASSASGADEPFFAGQWSLQNSETLAANGYPNATSLNVQDAWTQGAGNEDGGEVVVAVVDSGVDYTHEELKDNMWDEGLSYPALVALGGGKYGYNSTKANNDRTDPMDNMGHGTHVASTIAAAWNNTGIAGINNKAKIMAVCAVPNSEEENTTATTILGYNYVITAKESGVNIVAANNSWGPGINTSEYDTLTNAMVYKAGTEGIVSLFASGNSSMDNDWAPGESICDANPYILMVGALDSTSEAGGFSHWGERSVDVFSPGTQVLAAVTSNVEKADAYKEMTAQYLPWLNGSVGASSAYFIDDAEDTTGPGGITYDLVSFDSNYKCTKIGDAQINDLGYSNGGVNNNNRSLKFSLEGIDNTEGGKNIAVRVSIPAATWQSFVDQGKGDDLYIGLVNGASDLTVAQELYPVINSGFGWHYTSGYSYFDDATWDILSSRNSMSAIDRGKDENGNVQILLTVYGLGKKAFTSSDYIYIDNFSLGWASCANLGEGKAAGTYYYSDGTSMAAPNTTGVVSLLSSHAAAKARKAGVSNYSQDAETAREIVSFVKGGVTQLESLDDKCGTGGATNAADSYSAYVCYKDAATSQEKLAATAGLKPVLDSIADNGDGTCTLTGSFFGSEKGSLAFDGEDLVIRSWTDTAITFESLVYSKERAGKVEVTKTAGDAVLTGRDFLVMPAGSSSAKAFDALLTPDFAITYTDTAYDKQVTTMEANASEVEPVRMAAAAGYIYVYGTIAENAVPVLMRYNIEKGVWDTQNLLADVAGEINPSCPNRYSSMAAGVSEIYLKVNDVSSDKERLFTFDAATGKLKYDVLIAGEEDSAKTLGFYNGELYLVGGYEGESACAAIYPDTGETYWSSSAKLPVDALYGIATNNGSGLTLTGSFNTEGGDTNGWEEGIRNQQIDLAFDDQGEVNCTVSSNVFFPEDGKDSKYALDQGQVFTALGAAAVDDGVLVTGPVRDNGTAGMVDTWHYIARTRAWQAATTVRFSPVIEVVASACTYNGVYYVMSSDRQKTGVYQRFGSYELADWNLSDTSVAPTGDAVCASSIPEVTYAGQDGTASSANGYTLYAGQTSLTDGLWVVNGTFEVDQTISVTGKPLVIITDGSSLTVKASEGKPGIDVQEDGYLSLYGQAAETGKLTVTGSAGCAAIGGKGLETGSGGLLLYGCDITATGGDNGAGIGGGNGKGACNLVFDGCTVTATGGQGAAGIGGGNGGSAEDITIHSGTITATGGQGAAGIGGGKGGAAISIQVYAGTVTATSGVGGAGIGGGANGAARVINIRKNVSAVTATATGSASQTEATTVIGGAGIGGGANKSAIGITIAGGVVTAQGGPYAAGIGGGGCPGDEGDNGATSISVKGGDVTATAGEAYVYRKKDTATQLFSVSGAGIGGGFGAHGTDITLSAGTVRATAYLTYSGYRANAAALGNGADNDDKVTGSVSKNLTVKAGVTASKAKALVSGGEALSNKYQYVEASDASAQSPAVSSAADAGAGVAELLVKASASKSKVRVAWNKVSGATKYLVYAGYRGASYEKVAKTDATSCLVKSLLGKKLKAGKSIKVKVVAKNGKEVVARSAACVQR